MQLEKEISSNKNKRKISHSNSKNNNEDSNYLAKKNEKMQRTELRKKYRELIQHTVGH